MHILSDILIAKYRFVTPTPFAAFAFDPVEAMIMSLPIYGFSFILPMSDIIQLFVFMAAFIWTLLIRTPSLFVTHLGP